MKLKSLIASGNALLAIMLWLIFFLMVYAPYLPAVVGQSKDDPKIIERVPNVARIVRAWNSLGPLQLVWNKAMRQANTSIHANEPGKVLNEPERLKRVGWYKEAREAALTQLDALNELIEEESNE